MQCFSRGYFAEWGGWAQDRDGSLQQPAATINCERARTRYVDNRQKIFPTSQPEVSPSNLAYAWIGQSNSVMRQESTICGPSGWLTRTLFVSPVAKVLLILEMFSTFALLS